MPRRDLNYSKDDRFQNLADQTVEVHKMINGMIKAIKKA